MLTNSEVEEFYENGYVIVSNLVSMDEIIVLREAVNRVKNKVNANPFKYRTRYTLQTAEEWDTWGMWDILSPDFYEDCFADFLSNENVLSRIKSILGPELRFWSAHAFWSPDKVDYNLYWHRDKGNPTAYMKDRHVDHVQYNLALTRDYCFRVIPGSHKRPLTDQEMDAVLEESTGPLPGEIIVKCEVGDILLTHALTLHRGACKVGDERKTLQYVLQPKNETYGGQMSIKRKWMREESFLNRLNPSAYQLINNLIEWDNANYKND